MATDPVCGMFVDPATARLTAVQENRTYFFCSRACLTAFTAPAAGVARLRNRLAVAWPLAIVTVVLTYAWHPSEWPWVALAAAAVVQGYCAGPFYSGALDGLRSRAGNMDLLIAAGTSAAFLYSAATLLLPGRLPAHYYFDASTLIVALILTGNYLEHLTRHRAGGALRLLRERLPSTAVVLRDDAETSVPIEGLHPGDHVRVRPGERVPADGVVLRGTSTLDESLLTGESGPVDKRPGSPVLQGTVNGSGLLDIQVSRVGPDGTLEQLAGLLEESELSKVPLQRTADRIGAIFVPAVLVLGAVAAAAWGVATRFDDPALVVLVFVAVVITACPCAFGLAAPAALLVGTRRAAEEGIWFKDRDAIDHGARVDLVLTDKTGTLTEGPSELTDVWTPPSGDSVQAVRLAAAVEAGSEHPLAQAVLRYARAHGLSPAPAAGIRAVAGEGISGQVDGHSVSVERIPGELGPEWSQPLVALRHAGRTVSVIVRDGRPVGLLGFSTPVASHAATGVAALAADGIRVVMLTGDSPEAADAVARAIGISEVHARLGPADKLEFLARLRREGHVVAFVGDGLNDAPVLAGADVGIAVGSATDVAREAGGIILAGTGFASVAVALRLCRQTVRRVRQNFGWAIGYNAILLPIAAGALIPFLGAGVYSVLPVFGAAAMGLSSTAVLANSLSLRWTRLDVSSPVRAGPRPLPS